MDAARECCNNCAGALCSCFHHIQTASSPCHRTTFAQVAAQAAQDAYSPDVVGAIELLLLAGLVATVALSRLVASVIHFGGRVDTDARGSAPLTTADAAFEIKDWMAGRPLPTLEELKQSCVLIAEGSGGPWSMCVAPFDETCEPDETFSEHYGEPVYVCQL
jgi:hypothetical protein